MKDYLENCKLIHNKYDYSLSVYSNVLDKIKIICSEHGVFEQRLDHHKKGSICPKCAIIKRSLTNDEFIKKSKEINGEKYDYSTVTYVNHEKSKNNMFNSWYF